MIGSWRLGGGVVVEGGKMFGKMSFTKTRHTYAVIRTFSAKVRGGAKLSQSPSS